MFLRQYLLAFFVFVLATYGHPHSSPGSIRESLTPRALLTPGAIDSISAYFDYGGVYGRQRLRAHYIVRGRFDPGTPTGPRSSDAASKEFAEGLANDLRDPEKAEKRGKKSVAEYAAAAVLQYPVYEGAPPLHEGQEPVTIGNGVVARGIIDVDIGSWEDVSAFRNAVMALLQSMAPNKPVDYSADHRLFVQNYPSGLAVWRSPSLADPGVKPINVAEASKNPELNKSF